ncbi:MAG: 16S rRNA (guanine(966)-N(2))-methyltransferase RsmD [Phormidesmis sp. CAN_BIN36]|nr:16S rRNA (guanine(966)-N(2))-methyltransferase RsmD [Phormidesmis sp. CAN_BIN36]
MSLRIYGNRLIKTLPGQETRPTTARVRQAMFNIWQGTIGNCRWLDLCAGSGSMGAEALCRGANTVIGIERSRDACAVIQQNWQQVAKPEQTYRVMKGEVLERLENLSSQQFDHIYFDPPYASGLYQPVLAAIVDHHLLASAGELAIEHTPGQLYQMAGLEVCRQKHYGNTALTFYRIEP